MYDVVEYVLKYKLLDIGGSCVNFEKFGKCIFGVICRYGRKYVFENFKNVVDVEFFEKIVILRIKNILNRELVVFLRKRIYLFFRLSEYLKYFEEFKV